MRGEIYRELRSCLDSRQPVIVATVVAGPGIGNQLMVWERGETLGDLGSPRLNQRAALYAEQILPSFEPARKPFSRDSEQVDVFFDIFPPPPELIIVGAVHVAIPLVEIAKTMGFHTIVVDPRRAFATAERFPEADHLLQLWPAEAMAEVGLHESSYIAVLSHDLKIDLPALETALASRARYIGALGSKKTHQKRLDALAEKGFSEDELGRIRSPIGLDLGGRRAEEIALSIMAQVVAARHNQDPD